MSKTKMKTIMNLAMRGQTLALRYTRDRNGQSLSVACDEQGCVDVPEEEATFLLSTPGWRLPPKRGRPLPTAKAAPKPTPPAPEPKPTPPEDTEPAPEPKPTPPEDTEPTTSAIDELRTKAAATAFAKKWRSEGYDIPELDQDALLRDMKAALVAALFEDEDENDAEPAAADDTSEEE